MLYTICCSRLSPPRYRETEDGDRVEVHVDRLKDFNNTCTVGVVFGNKSFGLNNMLEAMRKFIGECLDKEDADKTAYDDLQQKYAQVLHEKEVLQKKLSDADIFNMFDVPTLPNGEEAEAVLNNFLNEGAEAGVPVVPPRRAYHLNPSEQAQRMRSAAEPLGTDFLLQHIGLAGAASAADPDANSSRSSSSSQELFNQASQQFV